MKAIPDLDFAAKQINKPSSNTPSQSQTPQSGGGTPEHRPTKPQHATHKLSGKEPGSRRGSGKDTSDLSSPNRGNSRALGGLMMGSSVLSHTQLMNVSGSAVVPV